MTAALGMTIDPAPKATPTRQHTVISLPSIEIKKKQNSLLDAIMEIIPSAIDDSSEPEDGGEHGEDPNEINMYRKIPAGKASSHGLPKWQSKHPKLAL
jgi:hypothetical protein